MEIDKTLLIPRDEGFDALVFYGPDIEISLDKEELVLEMVHAFHGVYKTAFLSCDVRYLQYWFRSERNMFRFVKSFNARAKDPIFRGWGSEEFSKRQKEIFELGEFGLLSDNPML